MADRYYLCAVVGNGGSPDTPKPWTANTGPYRAALADITDNQGATIRHQVNAVLEAGKYAICNVSSLDFTEIDTYTGPLGDYPLPDSLLDVSLDSDMTSAHISVFKNLLKKYLDYSNAEANSEASGIVTYRQAFDYLIAKVKADYTIDKLRAKGV